MTGLPALVKSSARWSSRFLGAVILIAAVIRLTARDRWPVLAPFYYATPWPVLAAGCGLMALTWKRFSGHWALLAWVIVAFWGSNSAYDRSPKEGERKAKVLFWNLGHPKHPSPTLVEEILAHEPDIGAFVEASDMQLTPSVVTEYERLLPGYHVARLGAGMLCVAKGEITPRDCIPLDDHSRSARVTVALPIGSVDVVLVDIGADPLYDRGPALRMVLARAVSGGRTITLGDFNTPYSSVHFDPYRGELSHAFEASGQGLLETWPMSLPLLSLDHIWMTKDLAPMTTRKRYRVMSDHAMLVTEISLPNSASVAATEPKSSVARDSNPH